MNVPSVGVGDLLSGSWELTQRIFENLSFREVARLRAVCKLWADVGAKILEKRRKLHYLTVHPHNIPTTEGKVSINGKSPSSLFEEFFEHIVSKPRYCVGFCNEDWLSRVDVFSREKEKEQITLTQYISSSLPSSCDFALISATGIIGTVEQNYQGHWLESANRLNREMLSFLLNKENRGKRPNKRRRRSNSQEPSENESEMQDMASITDGAAIDVQNPFNSSESSSALTESSNASTKRSTVGYSIEVEARWNPSQRQADAVTLLLIPHHPGVKMKFFHILEDNFVKDCGDVEVNYDNIVISPEEFNKMTSLTPDDDLKALLLFDIGFPEGLTTAVLHSALSRQNQKVAVGGGVIESFDCGGKKNQSKSNFGIAISGPNVMAASVIIPMHVGNPKALEEYMKMLKMCGLPEEQSFAFIFTCCGRGFTWYRRRGNPWFDYNNMESKAFRKVFPNTPVFGFFGGGEIGVSYLPKFNDVDTEVEESPPKKRKKNFFHRFTTVIVLLSFL
ncbi:hypothetical protein SK128_010709 [Halocaridina rubra]|uniref:F-box domain-containing protein n=1 Tax=Halocaridina rubra TaxID=373956 RepID=A0AAN9ADV9_HALRR